MRGDLLRPPHGTTPAAVLTNKNKKKDPLRAKKIFIREADRPYLGFGYKNIISDPIKSGKKEPEENTMNLQI